MFETKFFSLTKRKRKKYDIIFIVTLLKFRKKGKKRMKKHCRIVQIRRIKSKMMSF